mgnify:CR=1 FL=1
MQDFEDWLEKSEMHYPFTKTDMKRAYYADREMENPEYAKLIKDSQHIDITKIASVLKKLKK